ncbi:MAG TPA: MmcQ/YjbR family DNA-binding protein [Jatrophihabitans sp.]|nr:MmcQ/YjbR family DNA-binding protein [Jatrophihabitans sp.]
MSDLSDVRCIALALPRAYEAYVRDYVKFRVGRIVFASVSPDESLLGFGYPREAREALVASDPERFLLPRPADMRYQWVRLRLPLVEPDELEEFLVDAWAMCVPKSVAAEYFASR